MLEKADFPYVKPKRKEKRQRWLEMGKRACKDSTTSYYPFLWV